MFTEKQQHALDALFGSPKIQSDRVMKNVDLRTLQALESMGLVRKTQNRSKVAWSLTPEGVAARNAM
jgi:DNA-binding HxlR family transcriptional regulator